MFSEAVYSETEQGMARRLTDTADPVASALWNALTTDVRYMAWLAYPKVESVCSGTSRKSMRMAHDFPEAIYAFTGQQIADSIDEPWVSLDV